MRLHVTVKNMVDERVGFACLDIATKLYAVVDDDGEVAGIYSTLDLAALAMERIPFCRVEARELDRMPDEPEPRGEPDYGAPSASERLERDSFDADRGGAR